MSTARPPPAALFLLSSLATGGSELKTVRLANALAAEGIATTIAYLSPPVTLRDEASPAVDVVHLRRAGKFSLRALRLLRRTLREREVQTLVAVNLYPALYACLARAGVARQRARFIATVNTTDIVSRKLALQMHLYRPVLKAADVVVFGAEAQRRAWQARHGVGADPQRTRVIYNGVDTERFAPAALAPLRAASRPLGRFTLGTVGQMRPEKAHVDLVRATATLRARGLDVQALLVGDGAERAAIVAEIARLGLTEHVTLAGEVRDVRPLLARMDLFVLPSRGVETFSNAALEALACGLPVVGSDIGGMRELLSFGGGVTFPAGDVAALSDRLQQLLESDAARLTMAAAARRAAHEHFSFRRMVEDFKSLLVPDGYGACEDRAQVSASAYARAALPRR